MTLTDENMVSTCGRQFVIEDEYEPLSSCHMEHPVIPNDFVDPEDYDDPTDTAHANGVLQDECDDTPCTDDNGIATSCAPHRVEIDDNDACTGVMLPMGDLSRSVSANGTPETYHLGDLPSGIADGKVLACGGDASDAANGTQYRLAYGVSSDLQKDLEMHTAVSTVPPTDYRNMALFLHYFGAGLLGSIARGILYGTLMGVMAVRAHVYVTACIIVEIPWCAKFWFGFCSDWFPIYGYRRRYYCMMGWGLILVSYGYLALCFEEPSPYFCTDTYTHEYDEGTVCNEDASAAAQELVAFLTTATIGLALSESAADGLMVESAQEHEALDKRGRLQVDVFVVRLLGIMAGCAVMAFCYNGKQHLGFFNFDMGINMMACIVCIWSTAEILLWRFLSQSESKQGLRVPCCCRRTGADWNHGFSYTRCQIARTMFCRIYEVLCTWRFFGFFLYSILAPTVASMEPPSDNMMRRYWANVQQLQQQAASMMTALFYFLMLIAVRVFFLRANWRAMVAVGVVSSILVGGPIYMVTALDVLRNQYFFLIQDIMASVPLAVNFLVSTLACFAIAPKGHEATVYGFVTSVHAMAPAFARCMSNLVYGMLPVLVLHDGDAAGALSQKDLYLQDSAEFRLVVVAAVSLNLALTLSSLLLLPLLPNDNEHASAITVYNRNRHRGYLGVLCISIIVFVSVASLTLDILAIVPSAACLRLVGGKGC